MPDDLVVVVAPAVQVPVVAPVVRQVADQVAQVAEAVRVANAGHRGAASVVAVATATSCNHSHKCSLRPTLRSLSEPWSSNVAFRHKSLVRK
jgi:hypothetical protein